MRKILICLTMMLVTTSAWAGTPVTQDPRHSSTNGNAMSKTELMGAAGAFTDSTLWSAPGANGWTIATGTATAVLCSESPGAISTNKLPTVYIGKTFRITYRIVSRTAGNFKIIVGGYQGTATQTTAGWYTQDVTVINVSSTRHIYIRSGGIPFSGVISNLTIREIIP